MSELNIPRVAIIGAGLVGSLTACYLAKRGYIVEVYEYRNDIRSNPCGKGRSINLALSDRGLNALRNSGINEDTINSMLTPMYGRFIHAHNGEQRILPYDAKYNRCIFSLGRNTLNQMLLNEAEKNSNVKINFKQKVVNVSLNDGKVTAIRLQDGVTYEENFDFIIGCDGAYSIVRQHMIKTTLFNYSQTYIDHGFMELHIPASKSKENKMHPNHLHIWPRVHFMMIALPNFDKSWTVSLFMPLQQFSSISTKSQLLEFFNLHFPDALQHMGEDNLANIFFSSTPQPLITVKCNKYNVGDKAVILGDAAHAVVPFYGQGMNAGFEDCFILDQLLSKHNDNIGKAINEFSKNRVQDGAAISDLSMYNYLEMSNLVLSKQFLLRKRLDNFLYSLTDLWTPLYAAVTFSNVAYSKCLQNKQLHDKIIHRLCFAVVLIVCGILILLLI